MRLSTKVAYNAIVQVASKVLTTILGLAAVVFITRYLGRNGFGEYTTIITFLSFFGIMADLGLTLVTVQMISQPGADEEKIVNNLFSLRFFSAIILLSLAPLAVLFFPYNGAIKIGVAITAISFVFIALNQILVGVFQKHLRLDKVSIAEIASRIVLLAGTILAVHYDFGLPGIMLAIVAGSAVNFFLHFIFSLKFVRLKFEFDFSIWREVFSKSWPLALTVIFNLLYLKTDTLILAAIKTPSEVGIYGAAYKVIEILAMIPFMFAGVVLPILTNAWGAKNFPYFKKVLQKSFDLMIVLALPLVVGTQFLGKEIMILVAGKDFSAAGPALRLLIVAAGFVFFNCLLSHAVVAVGAQKKIISAYFFTAITSLAGYFIFIPRFSYFGAAAVTIYSEAAITILLFFYVARYADFFPKFGIFWKSLLASLAMGAALFYVPPSFSASWWGMLIVLTAASSAYFAILYFLKGITRQDVADLLNKEIQT